MIPVPESLIESREEETILLPLIINYWQKYKILRNILSNFIFLNNNQLPVAPTHPTNDSRLQPMIHGLLTVSQDAHWQTTK